MKAYYENIPTPVHVDLNGPLHIVVHVKFFREAPGVKNQVGTENASTSKRDQQANNARVQGGEEQAQQAKDEKAKGQGP